MNSPKNSVIVKALAGTTASLEVTWDACPPDVSALGFHEEDGCYVRPIRDDEDRRELAHALIELGALFSVGPGWAPSDLLEYYRMQGKGIGPFKSISWSSPDSFVVETR